MATVHTKDIQLVPPAPELVQWYTPAQTAAILGISKAKLAVMRVQKKGPRFRKLGDTDQSRVVYSAADIAVYQSSIHPIETEQSGYETQKAS